MNVNMPYAKREIRPRIPATAAAAPAELSDCELALRAIVWTRAITKANWIIDLITRLVVAKPFARLVLASVGFRYQSWIMLIMVPSARYIMENSSQAYPKSSRKT